MDRFRKNRVIYRLFFLTVFCVVLTVLFGVYTGLVLKQIPENIYVENKKATTIELNLPVTGQNVIQTVDFKKPVTFIADKPGTYKMNIKLFGLFDVSTVNVNVVEQKNVYPCGFPIGLYMKTSGVMVVKTEYIKDRNGNRVSPCENIIRAGDYIVSVNGIDVNTKSELIDAIDNSGGENIVFTVRRDDNRIEVSIHPISDENGDYKVGLWVKDDAQGIGTVTYIDGESRFGALGHGISDAETNQLLEISNGALYRTNIVSIVKGANGTPGEFIGTIDYKNSNILGQIKTNTSNGIYGNITVNLIDEYNLSMMPVGYSYEIHKGRASIRMYINGIYKDYDIQIENVTNSESKNLTFKVLSEDLLSVTNGIVQGMFTSYNGYNTRKTQ